MVDTIDSLARDLSETMAHIHECEAYADSLKGRLESLFSQKAEDYEGMETLNGGAYTVRLIHRVNRSIDLDRARTISETHGLALDEVFNLKPSFSKQKWNALPEIARNDLSTCVTVKKGKTGVQIDAMDKEK